MEALPLNPTLYMSLSTFANSSWIFMASLDRMVSIPACGTLKTWRFFRRSSSFSGPTTVIAESHCGPIWTRRVVPLPFAWVLRYTGLRQPTCVWTPGWQMILLRFRRPFQCFVIWPLAPKLFLHYGFPEWLSMFHLPVISSVPPVLGVSSSPMSAFRKETTEQELKTSGNSPCSCDQIVRNHFSRQMKLHLGEASWTAPHE